MIPASKRIAAFAARFCDVPLSAAQRHIVYRAVLDTIAVAVAGRNDPASRIAGEYLRDVSGTGKASAWTSGRLLPPESAAWLNGIAGHVLDYDDMLPPMRGHPSVAMLPALVALAQATGADGRRFSSAYIAGFEVLAKISEVMAIKHNSTGWHATSALGILGAATACSVLLGLNEPQICHALGLAVTQAAGNRQNFGTMAKSFQVGQCGAAAVRATLLAQAGFDAPADAIDGKYGYMTLYADREDLSENLDALGSFPLEFDRIGIDVKKYPCGYAIHRALDGVLSLRAKHHLTLDAVESVEIATNARNLEPLTFTNPENELEAKFSMEYPVAAALLDGKIMLSSFNDENVVRPEIKAFLPRIRKQEGPGAMLPRWATVKMRLSNGATLEEHTTSSRGDAQNPLTDDELIEKAQDCFSYGGVDWQAHSFAASVFDLSNSRLDDAIHRLIVCF